MKSHSIILLSAATSLLTTIACLRIGNSAITLFTALESTLESIDDATPTTPRASNHKSRSTGLPNETVGGSSANHKFHSTGLPNENDGGSSAICLIIKDDNDILAEWVAYHYHVFNLRRLIVAVDPLSKISPSSVLEPFETSGGNFDLDVTIWQEEDYTPTWFHSSDIDPSSYIRGRRAPRNNKILCDGLDLSKGFNTTHDIEPDIIEYCKYIKRQLMFYNECLLKIQTEHKHRQSWTALIDTDEFLVPNPWIADYIHRDGRSTLSQGSDASIGTRFQRDDLRSIYPDTPSEGSLWSLFHRFQDFATKKDNTCVMIPRINFGGEEDDSHDDSEPTTTSVSSSPLSSSTTVWDHKNFQTLRFKYHADHRRTVQPKAVLNAAGVDQLDQVVWGERSPKPVINVHVPHESCDGTVWQVDNPRLYEQPLAIHHYLGSLEQFMTRDDIRRTVEEYRVKTKGTAYARGDQNDHHHFGGERWWIKGWLDSFVETHGSEKVYTVLGTNYATISENSIKSEIA